MPRHFIDELDDTLQLDGQLSLTGGQVSNVRANLLTANQGTLLQNMDAEVNGELRTRRGFRRFGDLKAVTGSVTAQALHWFDSVTGEYLLAIAGGQLLRGESDATWTQVEPSAVTSTTALADMAQVNDRVFAGTRDSRPTHWNTAAIEGTGTNQIETATVGGAATASGSVFIYTTGADISGSPEITSAAVLNGDSAATVAGKIRTALLAETTITSVYTVGGAGADITLTRIVPAANDPTLNIEIDGNGTGVPDLATSSDTTGGSLGTAITDGPAKLAYLTAQKFRLFGINPDAVDEVYTSIHLPTGATPFTSGTAIASMRVGEGEGDPITGLFAWKGFTLLVQKEGSIWAVDTTPGAIDSTSTTIAAGFTVSKLSGRIGGVAHRSIVQAGNDVLFLSRDGVRSLAKTIGDEAGAVSEALSFPVEDYIQRINWQYVANACACYWQGRYLLAVPLDSSTVNDHILVYRPQTQAWAVWTGIQPVQFAVSRYNGAAQKLAVLDARGQVLVWRDYVAPASLTSTDFRDNHTGSTDSRIDWRVRTKALVWNEPLNPKQPEFLELEFTRSTALADVRIISDGDYAATLARKVNTGSPGLLLPFTLPGTLGNLVVQRKRLSMSHYAPVRELIVELTEAEQMTTAEAADSGYLSLRAIQGGAFVDTMGDDE